VVYHPAEVDYLERIARFVAETPLSDIPAAVLERAKLILADTLPVIAAGMRCPELVALSARQLAAAAPGPAWVIGAGRTGNALDAALLNGVAGAWLDFDEGNFLANGHPGIQLIPAALAVAQARRASGTSLLAAIALGYEVVARIGAATRMKLIVNPHGTYGVVGSALAVGRLTGLAPQRFRELASLAASSCMATNRHTMLNGATVRNWYAGHSAYMGQMALRLVESGFTGPADGVNTTFSLVLGDGFSPQTAVERLGERWLLLEGYIKLYPTARYAHSGIDAFFDAVAKAPGGRLAPEDIERIDVRAYRMAAFLKNKKPDNWFTTRFSIPFACATLLLGKRTGLDAFSDAAVADPEVQRLAAKFEVTEEEAFNAAYPARQPVALTIRLRDGTHYEGRCDMTSGEPGNPHPAGAIEKKYFGLADDLWGHSQAARLLDTIMRLEECEDVSTLKEDL
jgi:2-methylcitrate dehydratase PrpD